MFNALYRHWSHRRISKPVSLERVGREISPKDLGNLGEKLAAHFLRSRGRRIIYRNFRGPHGGELDLVTREGEFLCFVEVKTRRRGGRGRPLDAVDRKKRQLMRRGGRAWLKLLGKPQVSWRHDVVEVLVKNQEVPHFRLICDVRTTPHIEVGEVKAEGAVPTSEDFFSLGSD